MVSLQNTKNQIRNLQAAIEKLASTYDGNITLMEVCGTHTMAIAKAGLRQMLPDNIKLTSGPGCPVCVTPNESIDYMIELASQPRTIITTFGDMMRVPGSRSNLLKEKADGADIRIVYSPMDALSIAKDTDENVVFLGVGFETTAPVSAAVIKRAKQMELNNFSVFCAHKNMPGALDMIVNDSEVNVNGFILPGHVSTIIGLKPYKFLSDKYNIPGVVSGFEPLEILHAIFMLVEQIVHKKAEIENAYTQGVKSEGNKNAFKLINDVFENCDSCWRGLGIIPGSGYKIRDEYRTFDAQQNYHLSIEETKEHKGCRCGDILRGVITPVECPLFQKKCTPENPIGPCMVSNEGTCAAFYRYAL